LALDFADNDSIAMLQRFLRHEAWMHAAHDDGHEMKKENRIVSFDWSMYDQGHVVYRPAQMSGEELRIGLGGAYLLRKNRYVNRTFVQTSRGCHQGRGC
jgi:hypothetical protein